MRMLILLISGAVLKTFWLSLYNSYVFDALMCYMCRYPYSSEEIFWLSLYNSYVFDALMCYMCRYPYSSEEMLLATNDWDSVFTAVPIFAMAFLGQVWNKSHY
jgi:hypothetical protein